jgi:FMN reductase
MPRSKIQGRGWAAAATQAPEEENSLTTPSEEFPVTDEMLDHASEDSFPASDPPAYSIPAASGEDAGTHRRPAPSGRSPAGVRPTRDHGEAIDRPERRALVVGLGGSLSPTSASLTALEIALTGAEEAGAETRLLNVRELQLPMFAPQALANPPSAATELAETAFHADGLIWSSPLYHGTISGSFKNALDWLQLLANHNPPFLTDKVVGLISAAGGVQGLQAVNTMEFIVRALRGWAVPLVVPVARAYQAFSDGTANDPMVGQQLRALGREVASVCLGRRGLRT